MDEKWFNDPRVRRNIALLAPLAKLLHLMRKRSDLNLSARDFDFLLKLLAKCEQLGPMHGHLLSLIMQKFNLRHIPLLPLIYQHALTARALIKKRRQRQLLRQQQRSQFALRQLQLANLRGSSQGRNDRNHYRSLLSSSRNGQVKRQLRLLAQISSSQNGSATERFLMLAASFNGPLLTSFSCILLSIGYGRNDLRRFMNRNHFGSEFRGSLSALEYYTQQRHMQNALKALQRKFHHEVSLAQMCPKSRSICLNPLIT